MYCGFQKMVSLGAMGHRWIQDAGRETNIISRKNSFIANRMALSDFEMGIGKVVFQCIPAV